ncbi:MAG: hypothetical protein OEM39_04930 [Acidimicrobiia bacterium]|nr:hypothetical protein [Acidimicrobiia bacterium]
MTRHRVPILIASVLVMILSITTVALAAASNLYLVGDGVPSASLSFAQPAAGGIQDFDSDGDPGRTVANGGNGSGETDPAEYQMWSYDVSGVTLSVNSFTLWATDADMDGDDIAYTAFLLLCDPACSVLDSTTKSLNNVKVWKQSTLSLGEQVRTYGPGSSLRVKVIVESDSEDDVWLAYDSASYPSRLNVNITGSATTTTTTTTPGSSATTNPGSSTTTYPGSPAPTRPGSGTTTTRHQGPPGPPTTEPSPPTGPTTASTSTTLVSDSTSTTRAIALGGGSDQGDPPGSLGGVEEGSQETGFFGVEASDDSLLLRPQRGLSAAYATVVENVRIYWQAALALGVLMTVLLIAGFEDQEAPDDPGRRVQWHRRLSRI